MKNNKKFLFIGVLFFSLSVNVFSLTIEQVCNQLATNAITKGDFTQIKTITSAKGNRDLKSSGKFILSLDGIMWQTLKPFPSTLAVGRTTVVQISADGKKTVIDASDNQVFGSIATTLVSVFSNDVEQLEKNFITDFVEDGNGNWQIILEPKDDTIKTVLNTIKLFGTTNLSKSELTSIEIVESTSSKIKYIFENHTYPKELTDDEKAIFAN